MGSAIRLRKLIPVVVTGVYFVVAASAALSGATTEDTLVRAGVAGLVVAALAIAFLRTVEDALTRVASENEGGFSAATRPEEMTDSAESGES